MRSVAAQRGPGAAAVGDRHRARHGEVLQDAADARGEEVLGLADEGHDELGADGAARPLPE
eukprot:2701645-Alexandrium_andersonii.AAC.1